MGYNVRIIRSTARIPAANLQQVYEKMCALNETHHDQKRGGSWSDGRETAKWFSWMDENYPETCANAQEILEMLGFEVEEADNGDLLITGYDSKTGQEDLFLEAITFDAVGIINWVGEDGDCWSTEFLGDTVVDGSVVRPVLPKPAPRLLK